MEQATQKLGIFNFSRDYSISIKITKTNVSSTWQSGAITQCPNPEEPYSS